MDTKTAWQTLRDYAEGRIGHTYAGSCPDHVEGHDSRDPECLVCQALEAVAGAAPAAVAYLPAVLEQIAQSWDGCKYDAPGETLDIGADIRAAAKRLLAEQPAAMAGPTWGEQQVHALAIHMAASAPPSHKPRDYDADMAWAHSALGFIAGHTPAAPALEAPAAPVCERCGLSPAEHNPTHWCDNQSFAAAAPQAPAAPVGEYTLVDEGGPVELAGAQAQYSIERADGSTAAWILGDGSAVAELMAALRMPVSDAAQAAPAAPAVDAWLQPDDMAALQRFHETAEDDESYDIGKEAVARLCAFGCLQSHSFGRYSTTDFGDYLLDTWAGARTLPFSTAAERRDRAAQAKEGCE